VGGAEPLQGPAGPLEGLGAAHGTYGTGAGTWTATTGQSRVYRFSYTVSNLAGPTAQGDGASATFTWEAQTT